MVALLMRGTLPTGVRKQLREPFAIRVAPACGERAVGGRLGGLQRVVDDRRTGLRQDDERKARVALVGLAGDEADPLERCDLAGDPGRRDPEPLCQLGAAELLGGLA